MRRAAIALPAFALFTLAATAHAAVTPAELAQRRTVSNYLTARAAGGDLGAVTAADVADLAVTDQYGTARNGLSHLYLRQKFDGLEVDGTEYGVHLDKRGQVFYAAGKFVDRLAERAAESVRTPLLTADEAVIAAAEALGLGEVDGLGLVSSDSQARDQRAVFVNRGLSRVDIPVRLRYLRDRESDAVRLAWNLSIQVVRGVDWWDVWVDAETGALLRRDNWTSDAETYTVFSYPKESPLGGPRTDEVDPYAAGGTTLPDGASPFGWHDTDGIAGAEFTTTRGNNVRACDDIDNNNNCAGAVEPDGTAALAFTGPLVPMDLDVDQPAAYTAAAVVNLFYWNNVVHDVAYQYGFDEAAGNFQLNNYGRGGLGSDFVNADAQDGSGTNNANFSTPPDGSTPRMQMYRWGAPQNIHENSPTVADFPAGASTGWGSATFNVTNDLVFINDGEGTGDELNDGCCPVSNPATGICPAPAWGVTGKIALVRRGLCEFGVKGLNSQVAGAVGTIIINNGSNGVAGMGPGASGALVTIPVQMIGKGNGNGIVAELQSGPVNVTMSSTASLPDRDSDLDAGVIAHEYGHGISNRLTGGPANVGCLQHTEQAGEGWSDWQALFLHAEPSHTLTSERSIGGYVSFEPANTPGYIGIRRFAYTTDMAVNPLTYGSVADVANSVPHGIGTIWASILWETYWNLVAVDGFDPDRYHGTGGNNVIYGLVTDGMKLQPCSPSFVDARNAILAADVAAYEGDHECELWRGFAKRGLGDGASTGASVNDRTVTQSFALPAQCGPTAIFSNGFGHGDLSHWTAVP